LPRIPLLLLAFVCAGLLSGCQHKLAPDAAAAAFFDQVSAGKYKEAYASSAFGFQAIQTEELFQANTRELGLLGATSLQLGTPEIQGKIARLTASVQTAKGEKLQLVVTLHEEFGAWRVYSVKSPRSPATGLSENRFTLVGRGGGFETGDTQPPPDDKTLRRLVRDSLLEFNRAIRERSFSDLYKTVSAAWQAEVTEKQLQRAFQGFIDQDIDISIVSAQEPIFDGPPQIGSDEVMAVSGHYATQPFQISFTLKFVYEAPRWKLFGLDVRLLKPYE
jgi:hypothetical protein